MEDKNITVISDQANETNTTLTGSSMTKAGRLAMELSHEKKRLKQELEELHHRMVELSSGDNYNDEIFLDLNAQFHDKVHLLSGNKQLYDMIKKIVNFPTIIYLKFNVRTESDGSIHHHGEILKALREGDAEMAEVLMRMHVAYIKSEYRNIWSSKT